MVESEGRSRARMGRVLGLLILGGFAVVVGLSWRQVKVAPRAPIEVGTGVELPGTLSRVALRVETSSETIRGLLEGAVPREFAVKGGADPNLAGTLRRGDLVLESGGDGKRVRASAKVEGKVESGSSGTVMKGVARVSIGPRVGKDWGVEPGLEVSVDLEPATLKEGGRDVELKGVVEELVARGMDRKPMGERVAKGLGVKEEVGRLWGELNQVERLSTSPGVWLRVAPRGVTGGEVEVREGGLRVGFGVEVETRVIVKEEEPARGASALPELGSDEGKEAAGTFRMDVPVLLPFEVVDALLVERLTRKTISMEGDVSFLITEALARRFGDGVVLRLAFEGRRGLRPLASGTLYLTGATTYDPETKELTMDGLDYTAESRDAMGRGMPALALDRVLEEVKARAKLNLAREAAEARRKGNELLGRLKRPWPRGVSGEVAVEKVAMDRVVFAGEGVFLIVRAEGRIEATVRR